MSQRYRASGSRSYSARSASLGERGSARDYSSSEFRRATSPTPSSTGPSISYGRRSLRGQSNLDSSWSKYLSSRTETSRSADTSSAVSSRLRPSSPLGFTTYQRQSSFTGDDRTPISSYRRQSSFTRDDKNLSSSYVRQSSFTREERNPSLSYGRQSSFTRDGGITRTYGSSSVSGATSIPRRNTSSSTPRDSTHSEISRHRRDTSSPSKGFSSQSPTRDISSYSSSRTRRDTASPTDDVLSNANSSRFRTSTDSPTKDFSSTTSSGRLRRESDNPSQESTSRRTTSPTHEYDPTEQTLSRLRRYTETSDQEDLCRCTDSPTSDTGLLDSDKTHGRIENAAAEGGSSDISNKELKSPIRDPSYVSRRARRRMDSLEGESSDISDNRLESPTRDLSYVSRRARRHMDSQEGESSDVFDNRPESPTKDLSYVSRRVKRHTDSQEVESSDVSDNRPESPTKDLSYTSHRAMRHMDSQEGESSDVSDNRPESPTKDLSYTSCRVRRHTNSPTREITTLDESVRRQRSKTDTQTTTDSSLTSQQGCTNSPKRVIVTATYSESMPLRSAGSPTCSGGDVPDNFGSKHQRDVNNLEENVLISNNLDQRNQDDPCGDVAPPRNSDSLPQRQTDCLARDVVKTEPCDKKQSRQANSPVKDVTSAEHSESNQQGHARSPTGDLKPRYTSHQVRKRMSSPSNEVTLVSVSGKKQTESTTSNIARPRKVSSKVAGTASPGFSPQNKKTKKVTKSSVQETKGKSTVTHGSPSSEVAAKTSTKTSAKNSPTLIKLPRKIQSPTPRSNSPSPSLETQRKPAKAQSQLEKKVAPRHIPEPLPSSLPVQHRESPPPASSVSSPGTKKTFSISGKHSSLASSSDETDIKEGKEAKKFSVPSKFFKETGKIEGSKDSVSGSDTSDTQRNPRSLFRRVSLPGKLSFTRSSSSDRDFEGDDISEGTEENLKKSHGLIRANSLDHDTEKDKHSTLKKLKFWGRRDRSSDSSHSSDSRSQSPVCPAIDQRKDGSSAENATDKAVHAGKSGQTKATLKLPGKQVKAQKERETTVKVSASPAVTRKAANTKVKISVQSSRTTVDSKVKGNVQGQSSLDEGTEEEGEKDGSSVKVFLSKKTGLTVDHIASDDEEPPRSPYSRRRPTPSGRSASLDMTSSASPGIAKARDNDNLKDTGTETDSSDKSSVASTAVREGAQRRTSLPQTPGTDTLSRLKERRRRRRLVREQFLGISVEDSQSQTKVEATTEDINIDKPVTETKPKPVEKSVPNGHVSRSITEMKSKAVEIPVEDSQVPRPVTKTKPKTDLKPEANGHALSGRPLKLAKQQSLPSIDSEQAKASNKTRHQTIASTVHQDIIIAIAREKGSSGSEIYIPSVAQLREKFASEEIENTAAIPWRKKESERPHTICGERLSPTEMQRFVETTPFSLDIRTYDEPVGLLQKVNPTLQDSSDEDLVTVVRHDKYAPRKSVDDSAKVEKDSVDGGVVGKNISKEKGAVKKEDAKKEKKKSPFSLSPERLKKSQKEKERKEKERKEKEQKEKERKEKDHKEKEKKEKERKEKERRDKEQKEKEPKGKDKEHHLLDKLHLDKLHKEKDHTKDKEQLKEKEENEKDQTVTDKEGPVSPKSGAVSSLRSIFGRRKSIDKGGRSKHQQMRKDRAKTLAVGITSEILATAQEIAQRTEEERERVEEAARLQEEQGEREEAQKAAEAARREVEGRTVTDGKEKKRIAKKPKSEASKARQKKMAASSFKTFGGLVKTKSESQLNQGLHYIAADIPLDEPKPKETHAEKQEVKTKEAEMVPVTAGHPRMRRRRSSMFEEGLEKFFGEQEMPKQKSTVAIKVEDFDLISSQTTEQLKSLAEDRIKIKPKRRQRTTGNPVKGLMNREDVRLETETLPADEDAGSKPTTKKATPSEHPVIRRKKKKYKDPENLWRRHTMDLSLAASALAGLASTEDFTRVKLRKTEGTQEKLKDEYRGVKPVMLIHIKGRRSVQTRLVEPTQKSLNSGDCYVLITKDELFAWIGKEANAFEKAKVTDIASRVLTKRELDCKAKDIVYINQENQENDNASVRKFYKLINGDPQSEIRAASTIARDEDYEKGLIKTNMVYKVHWTEPPRLVPIENMCGHLPQFHVLDTKEVFVFDFGSEMYVWNGQQSLSGARKTVFALAKQEFETPFKPNDAYNPLYPYGREDGSEGEGDGKGTLARPSWALLARLHEKAETILFREKFLDWPDPTKIIKMKGHVSCGDLRPLPPAPELKPCEPKMLMAAMEPIPDTVLEGTNVGRGHGVQTKWTGDYYKEGNLVSTVCVTVWHINEYRHFALPQQNYGHFHSGEGYVIRWAYFVLVDRIASDRKQRCHSTIAGRVRTAYFFWQGNDCSVNEKGAAAVMAVELDEERGPQIRVVQGKEPPCFLNLFKGGMIIHQGNIAKGLYDPQKRDHLDESTERFTDTSKVRLYAVRNENAEEACLVQVKADGHALRSRSCFILLLCDQGHMFLWNGSKASNHTKKVAMAAAKNLQQKKPMESNVEKCSAITLKEIEEGDEPNEFWRALGGKKYYHSLQSDKARHQYQCRLWHMTSATGKFLPNEITCPSRMEGRICPYPFLQEDLYETPQPALMILDAYSELYVWEGWKPDDEDNMTGSARRRWDKNRQLAMRSALNYAQEIGKRIGMRVFVVYAGLEPACFKSLFPYWKVHAGVGQLQKKDGKENDSKVPAQDLLLGFTKEFYTLEELQQIPPPQGVDPALLEVYLSPDDFQDAFQMNKDEFNKLPGWKQVNLKKTLRLF